MGITTGTRFGPYEILSPLGAGGMGEVYKARDTRLERIVAIKVLPEHLSGHPELKQRFEREAKAISSLNHAGICQLYDVGTQDGVDFLVMEYLEGEPLDARLRRGVLAFEQVIKIGIAVAEALDKAHRAGIVHRDLKPGNIMITKAGAKLMDFGLAKPAWVAMSASGAPAASASVFSAPTMAQPASPLTTAGSIVGTVQYMSPEQIQGQEVDARSDIFSFGLVLYEMTAGRHAFGGKNQASVAAAILAVEPPRVGLLRTSTPSALERVIQSCIAKETDERIQSAHDLKLQLELIAESQASAATAVIAQPKSSKLAWAVAAVAVLLALAAAAGLYLRRGPEPTALTAFIPPPEKTVFSLDRDDGSGPIVISPGGKRLAFVATDAQNNFRIFVRALADATATPVPGTEGAEYPFWSPDSNSLGFFGGGKLRRVSVSGGPVVDICNAPRPRGGAWGPNDTILFAPDITSGIFRVSASPGATPVQVTQMAAENTTNRWPAWLPDGKHFLYLGSNHSDPWASAHNGIFYASLDGKENRFLLPAESNPAFSRGYLFWVQGGSLLAHALNPRTGELAGESFVLTEGVTFSTSTWRAGFDLNDNGTLIYHSGTGLATDVLLLKPDGTPERSLVQGIRVLGVRMAPDGRRAAMLMGQGGALNIWLVDLDNGTRTHFTFDATSDGMAWSGDGRQLYYTPQGKPFRLLRKSVDGGQPEVVRQADRALHIVDVSRDGRYLLFEQPAAPPLVSTTWIAPAGEATKARPLISDPIGTHYARFSADSRWVVYATTESGRYELYATSVDGGGKIQLTTNGGNFSTWSADGKSLYYLSSDNIAYELPITESAGTLRVGTPRMLFKSLPAANTSFYATAWDASPDGRRFIVSSSGGQSQSGASAVLITNWPARLKK